MQAVKDFRQLITNLCTDLSTGNYDGSPAIKGLLQEKYDLHPELCEDLATGLIHDLNRSLFPPVTEIELFLTDGCVLDCDYCFLKKGRHHHLRNRMSREVAEKAVDFLLGASREATDLSILFFGGEPLLELPLIRETTVYAEKRAAEENKTISFTMTTNGILLDEEKLEFLRDHHVRFLLSIDGNREAHDRHRKLASGAGSFTTIMEKIPLIKEYQPWLGARMTISPDIVEHLSASFIELAERGINQFLISPAEGVTWTDADMEAYLGQLNICFDLFEKMRDEGKQIRFDLWEETRGGKESSKSGIWGCRAGRHCLSVDVDGGLYPCSKMLFPDSLKTISCLGSVEKGLENIGRRMHYTHTVQTIGESCLSCGYEDSCTGGCYAVNYWGTGSPFVPSRTESCRLTAAYRKLRTMAAAELGSEQ
ncbi:MAG: radical SAM protein [Nitrospirales bacterium]|nr:radical SAM protein [Nitrospirales bacterium]